jgi:hypothetical protein
MWKTTKEILEALLELSMVILYPFAMFGVVYLIATIKDWCPWLGWWLQVTPMMP